MKNNLKKRTEGMVQVVEYPEFNLQYCKKKKIQLFLGQKKENILIHSMFNAVLRHKFYIVL